MVHMFGWFERWFGVREVSPAPVAKPRRVKTYQSESGYVYQYTFDGRHCRGRETEFVFSVSADRKADHRVSIVLPEASIAAYEKEKDRRLAENERYGLAKIGLFRLFDAGTKPEHVWKGSRIEQTQALEFIDVLGL